MENSYINDQLLNSIANQLNIKVSQIKAVLKLIEEGATVPFIARYRKEVTGGLDEEEIRAIYQEWDYGQKLAERKEAVMRLIEEKGKLTEELKKEIISATKLSEIEDIYRPFKEKRKTRATDAINKGLQPLADYLLSFPLEGNVEDEASKYVTKEVTEEAKKAGLVVASVEEALQGAMDIIAEKVSDVAKYRKWIRALYYRSGEIATQVKDSSLDEKRVYEMYYDYHEPIKTIKEHRVLAINRGEAEKVLKVSIIDELDRILNFLYRNEITNENSITTPYVKKAIEDAYKRLIKPSIEREIRSELTDKAEDQAIKVFAENLKRYLLTPPMKGKVVLGIDPAYRTGCKLAVVDQTGKFLDKGVIYPHKTVSTEAEAIENYKKSRDTIVELIDKYNVEVIAIGNGTASRETESFIADVLKISGRNSKVSYIIVNEAGASIYSASDLAREEFPDFHVEERSAVSIARRLQDPLAELVKIDPKSIGVGQYQYDVTQSKLATALDNVVEDAVNSVGVNINSASVSLLQRVSGLNSKYAKLIVNYRDEHGKFMSREDLKAIKGIGEKTLEQSIGFLRIPDGVEKLDMTAIHPESYEVANEILKRLGCTKDDIGTEKLVKAVKTADKAKLKEGLNVGDYTFNDILDAFVAPLRDPRDDFDKPILRSDVLKIEDLKEGMELQGTVRNVVDFGAFVDCGVKEDGLVHLSRMSKKYIKHPLDVVSVGQIVKVWVVSVDVAKGRVELTMIPPHER